MFNDALAEFVYTRTYSRWNEEQQRRETWEETGLDLRQVRYGLFRKLEPTLTKNGKKTLQFYLLDLRLLDNETYQEIKQTELGCISEYAPGKLEMDWVGYDYPGKHQFYYSQNLVLEQVAKIPNQ